MYQIIFKSLKVLFSLNIITFKCFFILCPVVTYFLNLNLSMSFNIMFVNRFVLDKPTRATPAFSFKPRSIYMGHLTFIPCIFSRQNNYAFVMLN